MFSRTRTEISTGVCWLTHSLIFMNMDINVALQFLKENYEVVLATSEDNIPNIRIFQIMKMEGTTLYFATAPQKDVYR